MRRMVKIVIVMDGLQFYRNLQTSVMNDKQKGFSHMTK